jgi:hypothetical protein
MEKVIKKSRKLPSLDLIYELSKNHDDFISSISSSIDTKAIAIFSIAGTLLAVLSSIEGISVGWRVDFIFFCLTVIAFLFSTYHCWNAFRTQQFIQGNNPKILLNEYSVFAPEETQQYLLKYWGENYEKNLKVIHAKGIALRYAIISTGIEICTLIVWVISASIK